jgi:hypothetical protein
MQLLCEHRSGDLKTMQREMESIVSRVDSRDVVETSADTEVDALVDRVKQTTLWRVSDDLRDAQVQDTLARREIRVMRSYRPKLLHMGTAAAWIRSEMLDVLVKMVLWVDAEGGLMGEAELFWDGCNAVRRSNGLCPGSGGMSGSLVRIVDLIRPSVVASERVLLYNVLYPGYLAGFSVLYNS